MNVRQERMLIEVRSKIVDIREILDNLMYRTYLEEKEFQKVKQCYDFICKANDQI